MPVRTPLNRQQITGFWAAWFGSTSHFGFGVVSGRLRFAGLMVSGAVRPSHRV
jgi:hypothetical protein